MTDYNRNTIDAYRHQLSILARCFHPSGTFVEFKKEEIEQSIPSRFEHQVRNHPDRLAIKTKSEELTFLELNQTANRVARAILDQRGDVGEPVVLLFGQSAKAITALLGSLKAGKIFVPLDPSFPIARTRVMVDEVQVGLVLTDSQNLPLARKLTNNGCQVINIDELAPGLSAENPNLSIPPSAIAYILYTSGSTGPPKGVVHNHRNLLHDIRLLTNDFHICSNDRLTVLNLPYSSIAIKDIFSGLLNGATLYPIDIREEGAAKLADWLLQEEITILRMVTTVFRHFAATLNGQEDKFPKLRWIRLGSEPVYGTDVELYKKHFSDDCFLYVGLSVTEAATIRHYFISKDTEISTSSVPVGYAVEDMDIVLLDDDGCQVGQDCVGEIVVKSQYLSLGYWRRPDLTEASFSPVLDGGKERMYRTGDLGRIASDGRLVHLGRKDFRVKIKGNMVDIAEVETFLLGLENVNEAAVIGHNDAYGSQRLVAYVVAERSPTPTVGDLRGVLQEKLPDYMVPSIFVFLDALPLLPGGKVNRLALPAPGSERPNLDNPWAAPQTPVEENLVKTWSEVLNLNQVGIHDNFLELGGDSLQASQIISRVINDFKLELPLRSLFEAPTVAEMALVIVQTLAQKANQQKIEEMLTELESISDKQVEQDLDNES